MTYTGKTDRIQYHLTMLSLRGIFLILAVPVGLLVALILMVCALLCSNKTLLDITDV